MHLDFPTGHMGTNNSSMGFPSAIPKSPQHKPFGGPPQQFLPANQSYFQQQQPRPRDEVWTDRTLTRFELFRNENSLMAKMTTVDVSNDQVSMSL